MIITILLIILGFEIGIFIGILMGYKRAKEYEELLKASINQTQQAIRMLKEINK